MQFYLQYIIFTYVINNKLGQNILKNSLLDKHTISHHRSYTSISIIPTHDFKPIFQNSGLRQIKMSRYNTNADSPRSGGADQ